MNARRVKKNVDSTRNDQPDLIDPLEHPIKTWAEGGDTPRRVTIVSDADTIIERIEDAASTKTWGTPSFSPPTDSLHEHT